jgi:hypothetical protein
LYKSYSRHLSNPRKRLNYAIMATGFNLAGTNFNQPQPQPTNNAGGGGGNPFLSMNGNAGGGGQAGSSFSFLGNGRRK